MLVIKAKTLAEGWEKSLVTLHREGNILSDPEILRDDVLLLEIESPLEPHRHHELFPMSNILMEEYRRYIVKGGKQGSVLSEHALYHHRLFRFPPTQNNQIQAIIDRLKKDPYSKRAQATLWYPHIDQKERKVPCLQVFWCRIENGKLVTHTHMRANDAYKKLLMNLNIFAEVIDHIARELNVPVGKYIHFVDSFHTYREDETKIEETVQKLKTMP